MTEADAIFKRAKDKTTAIDTRKSPKYIPLNKIIAKLKKTGSVMDTANILGVARQTIYDRLERANMDHREFTDYSTDKALSHEILQYRLNKGLTTDKIQKMNGGSTVLAICQLQDKISTLREGKGNKNNSLSIIINLANRANDNRQEIDITPGESVDK